MMDRFSPEAALLNVSMDGAVYSSMRWRRMRREEEVSLADELERQARRASDDAKEKGTLMRLDLGRMRIAAKSCAWIEMEWPISAVAAGDMCVPEDGGGRKGRSPREESCLASELRVPRAHLKALVRGRRPRQRQLARASPQTKLGECVCLVPLLLACPQPLKDYSPRLQLTQAPPSPPACSPPAA